eukprot:scaffold29383_cov102-Isochrysis_galbana.AAC.7
MALDTWRTRAQLPCSAAIIRSPNQATKPKPPGQPEPERPWLLHVHALGRPARAPIRGDAGDAARRHCLCRSAALGATAAAFAAALAASIST